MGKHGWRDGSLIAKNLTLDGVTKIGTSISDGQGVELDATNNKGVAIYTELPSTGVELTATTVARGIWGRVLVNKAQTKDISVFGVQGHLRLKTNIAASHYAGIYGYFEQSGTSVLASGCHSGAALLQVESGAALTISSGAILYGIKIDSRLNSSATVTGDYSAIYISRYSTSTQFANAIQFDEGAGASSTGTVGGSQAGYIKVKVGSNTHYIQLYPTLS